MLTAEELCDICGSSPAQRQAWAKEGDLRQRRGFEELDAAELATYARLRSAVGPKRAKVAWRDLRAPLQRLLMRPARKTWVVIETRGVERHALATGPAELARRVAQGRPLVVIDVRATVDPARSAYREAVAGKRGEQNAEVRELKFKD